MTLDTVLAMPAPRFALYREYHQRYGFEVDRIIWTIAKSGSRMCGAWGAKVQPKELIPEFQVERGLPVNVLAAELAALPGAKVSRVDAAEMARRIKASRTI